MLSEQMQHWFTRLTSNNTFFFAILDSQHNYCLVNDRYCDVSGLSKAELVGKNDQQILGDSFYHKLKPYYQRAIKGEFIESEISLDDSDIETSLQFSITPLDEGELKRYLIFHAVDTSEKHLLVRSLEEAENKFSHLLNLLDDGLLMVEDDIILSANPAAAKLLGYNAPKELLGEQLSRLFVDAQTKQGFARPLGELLSTTPTHCSTSARCGFEKAMTLCANQTFQFGAPIQMVMLQSTAAHTSNQDETPAANLGIQDPLTKLYNRTGFTQRLEQFIRNKTPLTLLYLDIDNFKNINDSLGHHIGDRVIEEVAKRLQRSLPKRAILSRFGGDEFGIIIPEMDSTAHAIDQLGQKVINLINQPFDLHHFTKRLACSIGSVVYPANAKDARSLLQNADTAMYEAKERGRNRLIQFHEQMNKEARMRLWLEIELQKALQQNGLEVWYQPKVNARDFTIHGAEALVRWKHPVEGYISPAAFIPVAEKAGLIEQLGKVVMREVFTTVKKWKQQNILPGRVAINLSPEQFGNSLLTQYMEKLLKVTGLDPNCITFELTESAVMSDSEHTLQMLNAIKKLGFSLSIDDFGTGYSSLSYLARFPIDELKIDRAFVCDIDTLPKQVTVIENIINLGHALELNVVAEGVENREQASLLSNLKCSSIQGFHFYRPQPKQEVEVLFAKNKRNKN